MVIFMSKQEEITVSFEELRAAIAGYVIALAIGFTLYALMITLPTGKYWLPYGEVAAKAVTDAFYRLVWFIEDMTEAQFYASVPAGIFLCVFGLIAWYLDKIKSKYAGFSISYGTGLWPWVFVAQTLGLFVSVYVCNYLEVLAHTDFGWVPTFVPFVSIPPAVIFVYGKGWKNVLTGAVLGGIVGFPIAWFVIDKLLRPWELPAVIGNVTGMWVGTIAVLEICRYLPWMKLPSSSNPSKEEKKDSPQIKITVTWFLRRVLADFTEAQFWGNEIASLGMIFGAILSWFLDPKHIAYASVLFPAIFASQVVGSATGILLYLKWWKIKGWYPTFVPVVSVGPAVVLTFGGSIPVILAGGILGGIIGPVVADLIIRSLPKGWHPVIGNTFSMAFSTALVVIIIRYFWAFGLL